jgi:uncharacterized membrane protein YuzA (DUF378 family)
MKASYIIALVLIIIGGLNWGLVGIFDFNLVAAIFGKASFLARTIYSIVGIATLWVITYMIAKKGNAKA